MSTAQDPTEASSKQNPDESSQKTRESSDNGASNSGKTSEKQKANQGSNQTDGRADRRHIDPISSDWPEKTRPVFNCKRDGYPCNWWDMSAEARDRLDRIAANATDRLEDGQSSGAVYRWLASHPEVATVVNSKLGLIFRPEGGIPTPLYRPNPTKAEDLPVTPPGGRSDDIQKRRQGLVFGGTEDESKNVLVLSPFEWYFRYADPGLSTYFTFRENLIDNPNQQVETLYDSVIFKKNAQVKIEDLDALDESWNEAYGEIDGDSDKLNEEPTVVYLRTHGGVMGNIDECSGGGCTSDPATGATDSSANYGLWLGGPHFGSAATCNTFMTRRYQYRSASVVPDGSGTTMEKQPVGGGFRDIPLRKGFPDESPVTYDEAGNPEGQAIMGCGSLCQSQSITIQIDQVPGSGTTGGASTVTLDVLGRNVPVTFNANNPGTAEAVTKFAETIADNINCVGFLNQNSPEASRQLAYTNLKATVQGGGTTGATVTIRENRQPWFQSDFEPEAFQYDDICKTTDNGGMTVKSGKENYTQGAGLGPPKGCNLAQKITVPAGNDPDNLITLNRGPQNYQWYPVVYPGFFDTAYSAEGGSILEASGRVIQPSGTGRSVDKTIATANTQALPGLASGPGDAGVFVTTKRKNQLWDWRRPTSNPNNWGQVRQRTSLPDEVPAYDSRDVASGNLDGDAQTELIVANYGESNIIWDNSGGGLTPNWDPTNPDTSGLPKAVDDTPGDPQSRSVAVEVGDVDSSNGPDIVVLDEDENNGGLEVWLQQPGGGFNDTPDISYPYSTSSNGKALTLSDRDGDGQIEIYAGYLELQYTNSGGSPGLTEIGSLSGGPGYFNIYQQESDNLTVPFAVHTPASLTDGNQVGTNRNQIFSAKDSHVPFNDKSQPFRSISNDQTDIAALPSPKDIGPQDKSIQFAEYGLTLFEGSYGVRWHNIKGNQSAQFRNKDPTDVLNWVDIATVDFDGDSDTDVIGLSASEGVHLWRNQGSPASVNTETYMPVEWTFTRTKLIDIPITKMPRAMTLLNDNSGNLEGIFITQYSGRPLYYRRSGTLQQKMVIVDAEGGLGTGGAGSYNNYAFAMLGNNQRTARRSNSVIIGWDNNRGPNGCMAGAYVQRGPGNTQFQQGLIQQLTRGTGAGNTTDVRSAVQSVNGNCVGAGSYLPGGPPAERNAGIDGPNISWDNSSNLVTWPTISGVGYVNNLRIVQQPSDPANRPGRVGRPSASIALTNPATPGAITPTTQVGLNACPPNTIHQNGSNEDLSFDWDWVQVPPTSNVKVSFSTDTNADNQECFSEFTPDMPGTYQLQLTVANEDGEIDTAAFTTTISNQAPTVSPRITVGGTPIPPRGTIAASPQNRTNVLDLTNSFDPDRGGPSSDSDQSLMYLVQIVSGPTGAIGFQPADSFGSGGGGGGSSAVNVVLGPGTGGTPTFALSGLLASPRFVLTDNSGNAGPGQTGVTYQFRIQAVDSDYTSPVTGLGPPAECPTPSGSTDCGSDPCGSNDFLGRGRCGQNRTSGTQTVTFTTGNGPPNVQIQASQEHPDFLENQAASTTFDPISVSKSGGIFTVGSSDDVAPPYTCPDETNDCNQCDGGGQGCEGAVVLDASGTTDPEGSCLEYNWSGAPGEYFSTPEDSPGGNGDGPIAQFVPREEGLFSLTLEVNEYSGADSTCNGINTATASVVNKTTVTVRVEVSNRAPTASIASIKTGQGTKTNGRWSWNKTDKLDANYAGALPDGRSSTDPEQQDKGLSYKWQFYCSPASPKRAILSEGTYTGAEFDPRSKAPFNNHDRSSYTNHPAWGRFIIRLQVEDNGEKVGCKAFSFCQKPSHSGLLQPPESAEDHDGCGPSSLSCGAWREDTTKWEEYTEQQVCSASSTSF